MRMRNLFRKETQSKMFTTSEAKEIAKKLKIDFSKEKFDLAQFLIGLNVELEHGLINKNTNVSFNI